MPSRLRGLAARVTAPVLSQGITALASLLVQVLAARALGLAGYGVFALLLGLLVSVTALYTAYVGDSLAVLDRHDPATRAALSAGAALGTAGAFLLGVSAGLVLLPAVADALVYGALLALWLVEDTVRRVFMARLEFWRLVGNDLVYLVGSLLAVLGLWLATGGITLLVLLAGMSVGALAAVLAGVVALPGGELRALTPGFAGMRAVASFAVWRCLHATLRPTALLGARSLVAQSLGLVAVGALEAGRLVVAPLQVVINGVGSLLLSGYAAEERAGRAGGARTGRTAAALATVTVLGGACLAIPAEPLGRLLTGAPVDPLLVLGWTAYLAVWAGGQPYVTEVVARRHSRAVFWTRTVDSVLGLVLVLAALVAGFGLDAVPWLMALGGCYSIWRLRALAVRTRPTGPG